MLQTQFHRNRSTDSREILKVFLPYNNYNKFSFPGTLAYMQNLVKMAHWFLCNVLYPRYMRLIGCFAFPCVCVCVW